MPNKEQKKFKKVIKARKNRVKRMRRNVVVEAPKGKWVEVKKKVSWWTKLLAWLGIKK